MGLTRSQLQGMVVITSILLGVVSFVSFIAIMQAESYKQATIDNCKQYEIIPEKYLDKVPSGCVPQWFKANENNTLK